MVGIDLGEHKSALPSPITTDDDLGYLPRSSRSDATLMTVC